MPGESTGHRGSCGVLVTTLEFVPSSRGPLQTYVTPSATSPSTSGAFSLRKRLSATIKVFQITATAFSTFLNRFAALVRRRTAAKGDSTTFVVRRCVQCSFGKA